MARTIVGTFATTAEAERVADSLGRCGIARRDIQIVDNSAARLQQQSWKREEGRSFWSWLFGDVRSGVSCEERHAGTWERFKDSIRYAWDRARGRARAA